MPNNNLTGINLYRYRYEFKNIRLFMDKEYPIRDEMAVSFGIRWDYLSRTQPVIKFILQLERDLIVLFYRYKKTLKISFDVVESYYDGTDTKIGSSVWISKSYSVIPTRDVTHYFTAQNMEALEHSDPMSQPQGVEMYLIDREIYNWFSMKLSINALDISKHAMLQHLFEARNIPNKRVVATPPEDSSSVDRIVLALGDLTQNIDELNMRYGIYTADALVFHDLDKLYCLNRIQPNVKIKSATQFDTVTFLIADPSDPTSKITGGTTDTRRKVHFINLQGAPEIDNIDTMIHSAEFSTMETIDAEGEVGKTTLKSDDARMDYIYEHNPLSVQQQINTRILTDQKCAFTLKDSPISVFRPYKTYNFIVGSAYSELDLENHQYRIMYLEFGMNKEGHQYESSIQAIIYRISNTQNI